MQIFGKRGFKPERHHFTGRATTTISYVSASSCRGHDTAVISGAGHVPCPAGTTPAQMWHQGWVTQHQAGCRMLSHRCSSCYPPGFPSQGCQEHPSGLRANNPCRLLLALHITSSSRMQIQTPGQSNSFQDEEISPPGRLVTPSPLSQTATPNLAGVSQGQDSRCWWNWHRREGRKPLRLLTDVPPSTSLIELTPPRSVTHMAFVPALLSR